MRPNETQTCSPVVRVVADDKSCGACLIQAAKRGVTIGQLYRLRGGIVGRVIQISHEVIVKHQYSDPTITLEFGNNILLLPMQRILNCRVKD